MPSTETEQAPNPRRFIPNQVPGELRRFLGEGASMSKIMTVSEVAAQLRINRNTIYKMLRSGRLPAFRIGSDYRFDAEALDRWCKAGGHGVIPSKVKPK